jgi:hypothetical protein
MESFVIKENCGHRYKNGIHLWEDTEQQSIFDKKESMDIDGKNVYVVC